MSSHPADGSVESMEAESVGGRGIHNWPRLSPRLGGLFDCCRENGVTYRLADVAALPSHLRTL